MRLSGPLGLSSTKTNSFCLLVCRVWVTGGGWGCGRSKRKTGKSLIGPVFPFYVLCAHPCMCKTQAVKIIAEPVPGGYALECTSTTPWSGRKCRTSLVGPGGPQHGHWPGHSHGLDGHCMVTGRPRLAPGTTCAPGPGCRHGLCALRPWRHGLCALEGCLARSMRPARPLGVVYAPGAPAGTLYAA